MPILNFYTLSVVLVSALLVAVSVGMMVLHVRTWRTFRQQELDEEDFDYRRRQYRRRMQTSAMLGLLAIALSVGHVLIEWVHSDWFAIIFWGITMLVACWVGLLALVDLWATKHHFGRLHHRCLVEQAELQAELRRAIADNANDAEKEPGL